jgi:hypothetical protein
VNTDYVSDAPQHAEVLILHADDFARIGTKDPTSAAGDVRGVHREGSTSVVLMYCVPLQACVFYALLAL